MVTPLYLYAWAAGHNVPLNQLHNMEQDIGAHNRRTLNGPLYNVGIASQPVNRFASYYKVLSGRYYGEGAPEHVLNMTLATYGVKYIFDEYLSSGDDDSVPMTLYTRIHHLATYKRYNCYLKQPSTGENGELVYIRQNVLRGLWRFSDLEELA